MKNTLKLSLGLLAAAIASNSFALTLDTPVGKQEVPDNPKRIVVLDYAAADTILALGEGSRVVGMARENNIAPRYIVKAFQDVPEAGNVVKVDYEALSKLNPDLIIISQRLDKEVPHLKEIAPVYRNNTDYNNALGSIRTNTLNFGKLFNKEKLATKLVDSFQAKVDATNSRIGNKTAIVLLGKNKSISAFGPEGRFGLVYKGKNGFNFTPVDNNLKVDRHGAQVSFEYLLEKNPDIIFFIDKGWAFNNNDENYANTFNNDITKKLKAYKTNTIQTLDAKNWYLSFGGINLANSMVDEINAALDKFERSSKK